MSRANDPAFPCETGNEDKAAGGMTLREFMAALIMAGFAADPSTGETEAGETIAQCTARYADGAVRWADALIERLDQ